MGIADCNECRKNNPQRQRQALGCGYEPRLDRVHLTMWNPPSGERGYKGPALTVCAGFSTSLPDVHEIAFLRAHWLKGALDTALMGDRPTEALMGGIITLDHAYNAVELWRMTPAAEGGGGP